MRPDALPGFECRVCLFTIFVFDLLVSFFTGLTDHSIGKVERVHQMLVRSEVW